jgi:hypothetical protein
MPDTRTTPYARLLIVDETNEPLFTFPDVPQIQDLLAAIKEQLVDISAFLSSLKAASGAI